MIRSIPIQRFERFLQAFAPHFRQLPLLREVILDCLLLFGKLQGEKLHVVLQLTRLELQLFLQQLLQDLSVARSGLQPSLSLHLEELVLCNNFRREVSVLDSTVAELFIHVPVVLELAVQLVELHLLFVGVPQQLRCGLFLRKQDVGQASPFFELLKLLKGIEDLDDLHGVHQADSLHSSCVVRPEQQCEDNQLFPRQF